MRPIGLRRCFSMEIDIYLFYRPKVGAIKVKE
jgi:hypothetical protein